jgi:uncharacterized membrane protein
MPKIKAIETKTLGLERLVFFSDAVTAIAITLLAIDLRIPVADSRYSAQELWKVIAGLNTDLIALLISFLVISVYWVSHHRYFQYIERYDNILIFLNMIFLFLIILMPFAASLLSNFSYTPPGVVVYASLVSMIGIVLFFLWSYASNNRRLINRLISDQEIVKRKRIALISPLFFILSIPLAFISPLYAEFIWFLSPIFSFILFHALKRNEK